MGGAEGEVEGEKRRGRAGENFSSIASNKKRGREGEKTFLRKGREKKREGGGKNFFSENGEKRRGRGEREGERKEEGGRKLSFLRISESQKVCPPRPRAYQKRRGREKKLF